MNPFILHPSALILSLLLLAPGLLSGPQPGQRPLPFTSNIVSGPQRGKQYCYVCELKDEPAVLVFARKMDEPTARLMRSLAAATREHTKQKLFVWFVFLGDEDTASETALEREAYAFARRQGAGAMPVSALGDPDGPPGYLISPEAETTVLMFRSGKVRTNRAFRAKEWSTRAADAVLKDLPGLLTWSPPAPAGG
jgi:hypothetical protein